MSENIFNNNKKEGSFNQYGNNKNDTQYNINKNTIDGNNGLTNNSNNSQYKNKGNENSNNVHSNLNDKQESRSREDISLSDDTGTTNQLIESSTESKTYPYNTVPDKSMIPLKSNTKSIPTTDGNDNHSITMLQHSMLIGCFALFVLFLFCATKKLYSNKKEEDFFEYSTHKIHSSRSDVNESKHSLKNLTKISNSSMSNFSFKIGNSGRKSRELIPSILKVSPAPLASLSDENLNTKYNEDNAADKDINVNESIIQAQAYERNSMNFNDIKTLSWHSTKGYQEYDVDVNINGNNISRSDSTDTNEINNSNISNDNDTNKLDNAVEFYFSNKRLEILRQNSTSSYSDIPDNSSSCGEPSLSRYIDNDALLKYESTRCKSALYNKNHQDKFDTSSSSNLSSNYSSYKGKCSSIIGGNRTSLSSSTIPSLSRYSIRNISSSIKSRNNRVYDSSSNEYASSNDVVFSNTNQKNYPKLRYSCSNFHSISNNNNSNLKNLSSQLHKSHRNTQSADLNGINQNLNYKIYQNQNQNQNPLNEFNLVKPKISTSPSLSSQTIQQDKSKISTISSLNSYPITDNKTPNPEDLNDISSHKKSKSNGSLSMNFHTKKDSLSTNQDNYNDNDYSSDSSDLEEELEDISHHQLNQSQTIDLNNKDSNSSINIAIPQITYKTCLENDLPTIIINSQNTASCCSPIGRFQV